MRTLHESRPFGPQTDASTPSPALDQNYGRIGISAVAAAVRYGDSRVPVMTPAQQQVRDVEDSD